MTLSVMPLRVIDLSEGIAGGYCTKLLCDLGADILKVERPGGDSLRKQIGCGATLTADQDGALFEFLSSSKRSLRLDQSNESDLRELLELASAADIVISGSAEGNPSNELSELLFSTHPHLTVVALSPFGGGGPRSNQPASDITIQAWSGNTALRGLAGLPPVIIGADMSLWCAGVFAAFAAAAFARESTRSGKGVFLDLSSLESMMLISGMAPIEGQMSNDYQPRKPEIEVPANEPALDGYVGFTTVTPQQWSDFCNLIGEPDWITNPDFMTMAGRSQRIEEVRSRIAQWTQSRPVSEIVEIAALLRIPVSPVENGSTLPKNEHVVKREMLTRSARSGFLQPKSPFRFAGLPDTDPGPSPKLNEHAGESWIPRSPRAPDSTGIPAPPLPLAGLRVADLTAYWAGPYATTLLALLGAEVIHVESTTRPDGMRFRSERPPSEPSWWEWGGQFHGVNGSKQGITLNLESPEGVDVFKQFISKCDLLVENFSPRVMDNFGLSQEVLQATNPKLIMVRMPAFGLDGPWRDRVGFAQTLEQLTGLAHVTGYEEGPPICPRGLCDPLAGIHAALAAVAGVEERDRTGRGRLIEVSMLDVAANVASQQLVEYSAYRELMTRTGNRSARNTQGVYPCKADERISFVAIAATSDDEWRRLCTAIGRREWASDPEYASLEGRRGHSAEIDDAISAWTSDQGAWEIESRLALESIPVAVVDAPRWNHRNDQIIARGFFSTVTHPICGELAYPGLPFRFRRPGEAWISGGLHSKSAPTLGQHNEKVLQELAGIDPESLKKLKATGIIGTVPKGLTEKV